MTGADPALWRRAAYDSPLVLAAIADLDGRVVDANRLAVEDQGLAREDVLGTTFWEGPWWGGDEGVRARIEELCVRAVERGALVRAESTWWSVDGHQRHIDLAIHPLPDASGRATHLFLSGLDTTELMRSQQAARSELADTLQLSQHVLANVADGIYGLDQRMRANFANASATRVLGYREEELLGRDLHALLHRKADGSPADPGECFVARALTTAGVVVSDREVFRRADGTLVPVEAVAVPTRTDGVVSGVVVSFRDLTERLAAEQQAEQLRLLAQREAVQRALSDGLQEALLTAPPDPAGLEIAVRYQPAAAEAQVGGDWYDAFVQPDGSTVVVIGDVVGHDTSAASAMAQLRGLLRGVAYATADPPSGVLRRFEAAAQGLGVDVMATVVLARVDALPGTGAARVVWSSAGHPPPVLVSPGGEVTVLRTEADLLLGIDPTTSRHDSEVDLRPGHLLLLYTDGLVERRGEDLDTGLQALCELLGELVPAGPEADLDALCDALLHRSLPPREGTQRAGEDDVALLALRRR